MQIKHLCSRDRLRGIGTVPSCPHVPVPARGRRREDARLKCDKLLRLECRGRQMVARAQLQRYNTGARGRSGLSPATPSTALERTVSRMTTVAVVACVLSLCAAVTPALIAQQSTPAPSDTTRASVTGLVYD